MHSLLYSWPSSPQTGIYSRVQNGSMYTAQFACGTVPVNVNIQE
uniref:Uncharacterized protein n=1 Tax=Anguilla anguilla TaxID=7936 RepID=A0A0E9XPP8_ANGAN